MILAKDYSEKTCGQKRPNEEKTTKYSKKIKNQHEKVL